MFGDWKEYISRKFNSNFNLKPKDIRRASIKYKGNRPLFAHSSEHSNNKESKINKKQSVNPREELKSKSKAKNPRTNKLIT